MRCPKCGAFLEEGRTKCFMCGSDININAEGFVVVDPNSQSMGNVPPVPPQGNGQMGMPTSGNSLYFGDVKPAPVKKSDRDIIDIIQEHKVLFRILLILLGVAVVSFVIYEVVKWKKSPKIPDPVFSNLYYEVDSSFVPVSASSSNITYSKSDTTGTLCSISISIGTGTESDHINGYLDSQYYNLLPETGEDAPADLSSQISRTDTSFTRYDSTWYMMNIFYRNDSDLKFTVLKYQFLSSVYNGYYYDIVLSNPSQNADCAVALDKFTKTLQFTD